jgi:hypothetical protein
MDGGSHARTQEGTPDFPNCMVNNDVIKDTPSNLVDPNADDSENEASTTDDGMSIPP